MYDNDSDTSDINADDIDKILENMDDLDNALLRGTLKSNEHKKESTTQVVEPKKKVVFRDFNEDDPLADLLSEEDASKDTSIPITTSQNKKIADLFGIKSEEIPASTAKSKTPQLNVNSTSQNVKEIKSDTLLKDNSYKLSSNTSAAEKSVQKKAQAYKSIFDDNDDIVSNLTEKTKPISEQSKKSSLMENLFGGLTNKSSTETSSRKNTGLSLTQSRAELNPTKGNSNLSNLNAINPTKIESTFPTQPATHTGYSPTTVVSAPRESRRGRRPSTGISDPLGLLSSQTASDHKSDQIETDSLTILGSIKKEEIVSKIPVDDDLPEWLGGRKISKEGKSEETSVPNINAKQPSEPAASTISATSKRTESIEQIPSNQDSVFLQNSSVLLGTQFDQQAALVSMQQQENVLRTAATLSQQNEKFNNLLGNQTCRLNEQEKQFNMLISRQIERQNLLEAQMNLQQNRIDSYLQTLMSQPSSAPLMFSGNKTLGEIPKDYIDKNIESESLVQKLQLEKLYLESTIESLKQKHEKEMMIFDESYKKQVQLLEDTIDKFERKMQLNFENLEADYEAKLQKLKVELSEMEKVHKEEKEEWKKEHILAVQQIYERHSQNIILLQNEHAELIHHITKAKAMEQEAVKAFANHKENIDDMLTKTDNVIENMQSLQKKIEERNDTFHESREVYFKTQVDHLKLMREQLEKQNETSENERKQLLIAAQKLEKSAIKLAFDTEKRNEQNTEIEDRLKMKEQALLREKELFFEQTKWERNHLETMKETWRKEQEKQIELLAKEREVLLEEKGKLQISNRLKSGNDDVAKAELEAMIKSAQDASENAFRERRKWQDRINEIELQKNVLQEKEDQLVIKAKELETLTQSVLAKRDEGLRALKEARRIEEESKERMNQVQTQFEILAQRENRIAAEKLSLARERLSLKIGQVEKPEKDINVIESQDRYVDYVSDVHSNMVKTHFTDIVDPQLILLKLDLDNKLDASSQYFDYIHTGKH